MHPKTDILVLVHNQLPITQGFIRNLYKNTQNFNLIFLDNGSTDDTPELLKTGNWKVITSKENIGIIKGRNQLAKEVTSDYFVNLDNDQYVNEGWLESLFELMNKGNDVVGAEAWLLLPPDTKGLLTGPDKVYSRAYFPIKRCTKLDDTYSYVGCGGMLIKKSVYKTIGLFDEIYSPAYFEDPDFSWRCIKNGYKIAWDYNCKINHLANSTTNKQNLFNRNTQFLKSLSLFQEKWKPFYPGPFCTKK